MNGKPISQAKLELLVRERVNQGQQDSPELRSFLKQELINREILQQESDDLVALRVERTPTFFVNGKPLPTFGAQQLVDLVANEVKAAKSKP